jgi:CheY-like chemotaxis protein
MSRAAHLRLIQDALARFHDLPFLPAHELTELLDQPGRVTPADLQRLLLRGIEALKPPPALPPHASRVRQYHYLRRRYLEGAGVEQIQRELALGDRQVRREHQAALQSLAAAIGVTTASVAPPREPAVSATGVSSLDAELAQLELEAFTMPTALGDVLAATLGLLEPLMRHHRVTIETAATSAATVVVVPSVLRHLLLNLLSYLITRAPGGALQIEAHPAGEEVTVSFVAHPPAAGAAGASGTATPAAGNDRAIATAHRLAEEQAGRLTLSAGAGGRLTARLTLPAVKGPTVLVIDDNADVGQLFRRYLQGAGFRVVQARTGQRALRLAETAGPAVVVLDLMLQVEDGWEIFRQLKQRPATRHLPVIACTVLPERELAFALGVDGFLAKPVTRQSLLAALQPYRHQGA